MEQVLLDVSALESGYDGGRVLNGVSFQVKAGEVVGMIGRNGVGKTTLMRSLIGLIPLTGGNVVLDGVDISTTKSYYRAERGMGYVPQGREIFGGLTVAENLQVGMQVRRTRSKEPIDRVISYFPILGERLNQKAGTMSGGEQQQLAIARALVGTPKILLLDEPSEGVQPSIVHAIADTLSRIVRELSIGVILVEQDIAMIQRAAHRCCVMDKGHIIESLTKDKLTDEALMRRYLSI
jgi:branched-chain amino acid transport system ATP-binding protein